MPVASLPVETMIEIEPSGLTVFGEFWSQRVQPGLQHVTQRTTASLHAAMGGNSGGWFSVQLDFAMKPATTARNNAASVKPVRCRREDRGRLNVQYRDHCLFRKFNYLKLYHN